MPIEISDLSLDERESWEQLYRGYAEFYEVPMNQEILDSVWSWIFDEQHKFSALVAKSDDGDALGFIHYREMASPLRGKMVRFLDDLFVYPEYRGQGVVDALFGALHEIAKNRTSPFVRWITGENNYRGKGFYNKLSEKTQWLTYQMPVE